MRLWIDGVASCVAALQTKNQKPWDESDSACRSREYRCSNHQGYFAMSGARVPGLPIRNCAHICNNLVQMGAKMSAIIDVIAKKIFERLYLVSGLGTFGLCVNSSYAPTTPTVHLPIISRFPSKFFPRMALQFFCLHYSTSNLAESVSWEALYWSYGITMEAEAETLHLFMGFRNM